jgi:hypothetical protein
MEKSRLLAACAATLLLVAVAALAYNTLGGKTESRSELLSPLQVGRYAVRAERQSSDYDAKAERQIAFATDNDNAATAERELAAKEEKRARDSAYLAADIKSRIDKILEAGRDQVGPSSAMCQEGSSGAFDDQLFSWRHVNQLEKKYSTSQDALSAWACQAWARLE